MRQLDRNEPTNTGSLDSNIIQVIPKTPPSGFVPTPPAYGDAGLDLRSAEELTLRAHKTALVGTGLSFEFPAGYVALVHPRSGLALNHGITVLNAPGTIDSGYRGEIGVILINTSDRDYKIKYGDKIAQVVFQRYRVPIIEVVSELSDSQRGEGGFGSTGY